MQPRITVVILTLNEQDNIADCIGSLARQTVQEFETIVIDANSQDATLEASARAGQSLAGRFCIRARPTRIPIGEARNLGARLAKSPAVAYLSADVEVAPDWVERALDGLEQADIVFGRQLHAPRQLTVPAAVRGLRYAFPTETVPDGARFASNVAGAYKTEVLRRFPFDDEADASEDLVLVQEAKRAGCTVLYDPAMCVMHHDVTKHREEWSKNVREGRGWATYRTELGLNKGLLAWGGLLTAAGLSMTTQRLRVAGIAGALALLWAPTLRRVMRNPPKVQRATAAKAVAVSPLYDLAFLTTYVGGLMHRPRRQKK